jgi:hypothetical protein
MTWLVECDADHKFLLFRGTRRWGVLHVTACEAISARTMTRDVKNLTLIDDDALAYFDTTK